ncbi:MAG: VOC family protein [Nitrosomonadales bacterium]|nr:VOC family protein [Nitrosomonadales bacterium]
MMMKNALTAQLGNLILGIDHVAIAVEDIDASIAHYSSALGFSLLDRSEVNGDHTGMVYAVLKSGSATVVLVQGTSPESQVSKFLAAFGTGMHHIAFSVSDLDAALAKVREAGGKNDTPVISDDGIRQTFLQRDPATGVRIELIERTDAPFSEKNVEGLFRALEARDLY